MAGGAGPEGKGEAGPREAFQVKDSRCKGPAVEAAGHVCVRERGGERQR